MRKRSLAAAAAAALIIISHAHPAPGRVSTSVAAQLPEARTEEYCLEGEFDLGARYQGRAPATGERSPARWCVVTETGGPRVRFHATGHSNPDVAGSFAVAYLPPDRVRIVNADTPPDVEFAGAVIGVEARAVRRLDPLRLAEELAAHPEWIVAEAPSGTYRVRWPGSTYPGEITMQDGRPIRVETKADLPLRGSVPVVWRWDWAPADGRLQLEVDGETLFTAAGHRRVLSPAEAATVWSPSGGQSPSPAPGKTWPALVQMSVQTVADGVYLVRGVRTGFRHLVVSTSSGLVVADAPAGWVEMHQLPPGDLVPGLGVSGLSERLIDFLRAQWPGVPIRAVALTHHHDDHAGGARAFAAAGASVYAPAEHTPFLERALNRPTMPTDRLAMAGRAVEVTPVSERLVLPDPDRQVELLELGPNPHVQAALGVYVPAARVFFQSDLHVPNRADTVPRPDRLATECWFARWAAEHLPEDTVVHNSHSSVALTVRQITGYLEHEGC